MNKEKTPATENCNRGDFLKKESVIHPKNKFNR